MAGRTGMVGRAPRGRTATTVVATWVLAVVCAATVPAPAAHASSPPAAADGDLITYSDAYGIRLISPDGSGKRYVLNQPGARAPRWSPDGQRIAFHHTPDEFHSPTHPGTTVWIMDADGGNRRQLTTGSYPQWLPSGRELLVARATHEVLHVIDGVEYGTTTLSAVIYDIATGAERPVPADMAHASSQAMLSRDGTEVAFHWTDEEQYPNGSGPAKEIVVVELDGSNRREVALDRRVQDQPPLGWTIDGRVLYTCEEDSSGGQDWAATCAVDPDTGAETILTAGLGDIDVWARSSPSGAQMVVGSREHMYITDAAGRLVRRFYTGTRSYTGSLADWRPRPLPPFRAEHATVLRLYRAFFDREPDRPGAIYWIDAYEHGASHVTIAESFSRSAEFAHAYGGTTNSDYVRRIYRNVLDREPEPTGYDYWLHQLQTGAVTRATLVLNVAANPEFTSRHPYHSIPG